MEFNTHLMQFIFCHTPPRLHAVAMKTISQTSTRGQDPCKILTSR